MSGIGIISNPFSRKNRKSPGRVEALQRIVGDAGLVVSSGSAEEVSEIVRRFKDARIEILGINGGDGSNHVVLSALVQEYGDTPLPRIAFLRGGTMNTISNACGIRGSQVRILTNLVQKHRAGEPFETLFRNTLRVGDRHGFIFGNGLILSFLVEYYGTGNPSPWTAAMVLSRMVGSALVQGKLASKLGTSIRARVIVDGQSWPWDSYTAVLAATIEQIGLGFKPFFRCEERPHSFHLLGVLCSPAGIAAELPRIYRGKKPSPQRIKETVAERVEIHSEVPLPFILDGDEQAPIQHLILTVGPRIEIVVR